MAVSTSNYFGRISISDKTIARVVASAAFECYGIVDLPRLTFKDKFLRFFGFGPQVNGVKVKTMGDKITVDIYVVIKYGVSITAVAESLKSVVKYKLENFTGMLIQKINISVVGSQI